MTLRVVCGIESPLEFVSPRDVLRPRRLDEALDALQTVEAALNDGAWIAGYFTYEFGAAMHGIAPPQNRPLFSLGLFDGPRPHREYDAPEASGSPLLARIDRAAYDDAISAIQRAIYDGDVYQINYTVPFDFQVDGSLEAFWHRVAAQTGAAYQAYVEDECRSILSWSPELFLGFEGNRIFTRPMKGTAPPDEAADLSNEKNRAEHVMIVDLLRNDLRRIARDVNVEALCTVERYPTLVTMTSTIAGTLMPAASLSDILRATFPCGSITGAPKRAAVERIARFERHPRGVYCGSIGYLSPQRNGWWNVAIRTAQFDGTRGRFDTGGGIVADSSGKAEWDELLLKTSFLRKHSSPLVILETFAAEASGATRQAHIARMEAAAQTFGVVFDCRKIEAKIDAASAQFGPGLLRVRLHADGSCEVRHEELHASLEPVPICIAPQRVDSKDPFLRYKTSWRPAYERASQYAASRGCFDALLRNERDELTEGSRTNFFAAIDGVLWTPPLESGLLPGILRSRLITEGRARERVLRMEDVLRAEQLYVGNSARGLLRARLVQEQE